MGRASVGKLDKIFPIRGGRRKGMITSNLLFCMQHLYEDDYFGEEHSHPCYELVYYCEGEGSVSFSKKEYRFRKDMFMVCSPEVKHIERGAKGTKVLYIGFELYGDNITLPDGLFEEEKYGVKEYLEKIYYETKHWTTFSYQLINLFCTIIAIKLVNRSDIGKEMEVIRNFDNIIGYISANYREDIHVKKLAEMSGYSYDHFRKLFAKQFHISVNDFILQKRIDAANDMLKSGEYLIKEIASDCGFSSVAQFCTKYREMMGISPKQMQKKVEMDSKDIETDKFSEEKPEEDGVAGSDGEA